MKNRFILPLILLFAVASCHSSDDFEFTGKVVDYELCNSLSDIGYAVQLTSPDTLGGDYMTQRGETLSNVVMIYQSPRLLKSGANISGRIVLDPKYSKTECMYHYNRDIPEARFTKLTVD